MVNKNNKSQESGFASITIALIMVLVLALLTVGFAQLARREQQSALDNQLSTQAYYAAESAINEVKRQLDVNPEVFKDLGNKDKCVNTTTGAQITPAKANTKLSDSVAYGCVIVDVNPLQNLQSNVKPNKGRNATFVTNNKIDQFTFEWSPVDKGRSVFKSLVDPSKAFPPVSLWGDKTPAVIQLSLTPIDNLERTALQESTFNIYLYPSAALSGTVAYSTAPQNQGKIVPGNCVETRTYMCNVKITGLPNNSGYLVHFISMYDESNALFSGQSANGTKTEELNGSQAVIDVTGKAQNVLKRIRVAVPLSDRAGANNVPPDFVIQSSAICKRPQTRPGNGNTTYSTPGGFSAASCQLGSPTF